MSILKRNTGVLPALLWACLMSGAHPSFAANEGAPHACVLNFEKLGHKLTVKLVANFGNREGVELINEALPTDILKCMDEGVTSILIAGHAGAVDNKKQSVAPLVYVKQLHGQEREDFIQSYLAQTQSEISEQEEKKANHQKGFDNRHYQDLLKLQDKLVHISPTQIVYDDDKLVESVIWERVSDDPKNLKKIVISVCMPEAVAEYYPELKELQARGIEVEFAPINHFVSFFMGRHVTTPNYSWMKNSLAESNDPRIAQSKTAATGENPQVTTVVTEESKGSTSSAP